MLGFPAFPDVPLAELFQAMDKFQSHLATMDTSHLSGDKLEGFEEIRSLFAEKAAFLKAELPGEFNRIRGEYNGLLGEVAAEKDKLDQEIARARQLAQDLPAIRDKAAAEAEKARLQAEKDLKDKIQALLAPLQKGPQELPLAEGEVLRNDILKLKDKSDLQREADTRHQRTSGNIWENWKMPELPLAKEEVLKEDILKPKDKSDLQREADTRNQRTSGNIWENWKMPGQ